MENRKAEEEPGADEVGLVVKSPAQRHPDLLLSARRSWSVRRLKAELRHLHPDEPVSSEMRMRTRPACLALSPPFPLREVEPPRMGAVYPTSVCWLGMACQDLRASGWVSRDGPEPEGWPSWLGLGRKRVSKAA